MIKPASLRAAITASLPELLNHPDKLQVFIDQGKIRSTAAATSSFEWSYTVEVFLLDFTGDENVLIVAILDWCRIHQLEILDRNDPEDFTFEADIINHQAIDLSLKLKLTERIIVNGTGADRTIIHAPEPEQAI